MEYRDISGSVFYVMPDIAYQDDVAHSSMNEKGINSSLM